MKKNAFYAQSGGVTSVINATASALILEAKKHKNIGKIYAGKDGILGALNEDLIDTSKESISVVESLKSRQVQSIETEMVETRNLLFPLDFIY